MAWMNYAAALLGGGLLAMAGLWCLAWGLTTARLMRLRLRESQVRLVERDAVAPQVRAALDTTRPLMQELGFVYRYSTAQQQSVVTPGDPLLYCDVYQHAQGLAFASVMPSITPERGNACNISWATLLRSGQTLGTVNAHRHNLLGDPKGWLIHDDYLPGPRQAWEHHRLRLAGQEGDIVQDSDEFFRATRLATEQLMAHHEQQGLLARRGELWQLRWVPAMARAGKLLLGQRRAGKVRRESVADAGAAAAAGQQQGESQDGPAQLQADIHAFEQHQAVLHATRVSGGRKKLRTLVITAALFLAVGSLWISWTLLPVLLAVIALHEAGHYLAMKLSGYGNLSVFFVPGLGGAAVGEKANAGPWEKLFVYLAGPMPGIALAMAGLVGQLTGAFQPPGWFHEFLLTCLVINYLNLLPVTPLDGGRIVETFLFARLPAARFAFALLGLGAFVAFGLYSDDKVLLAIAVLVGLSLPHQWRVMRVDRAIERQSAQTLDERGATEQIFTALQRPAFARWPFSLRAYTARALLPELQGRRAGVAEAVGGMLVYLACLFGPLALALVAVPQLRAVVLNLGRPGLVADDVDPQPRAAQPASPPRDLYAEAARVQTLPEPQRLPLLLDAADFASESDDRARQKVFLDAAWALAQARPPGDYDRARTLMALASADEGEASAGGDARRRQVIAELAEAGDPRSRLLLADAHEQLAWDRAGAERVTLLRRAVALRTQASPEGDWLLNRSRRTLAQALDDGGASGEAEALLRGNVQALVPPAPGDRTREALDRRARRVEEQVQLAWFLLDHARAQDAGAVLDAAAAALPHRLSVSWTYPAQRVREAQLWVALQGTDAKAIRETWQAYEASREDLQVRGGNRPHLPHELDRYLVAQATADAALKAQARTAVAASLQGSQPYLRARFCEPMPPASWRTRQQQARGQAAKAAGVCGGT